MPINNDRKKRPKREYADATQSVEPTMPINDDRKKHPKREYADGSQSNDQKYTQRRDLRSGYLSIQSYIRGTFHCLFYENVYLVLTNNNFC